MQRWGIKNLLLLVWSANVEPKVFKDLKRLHELYIQWHNPAGCVVQV